MNAEAMLFKLEVPQRSKTTTQRLFSGGESYLEVSCISHEDNSAIGLSQNQMSELHVLQGDFVSVRGHNFATTLNVDMNDLSLGTASLSRDVQTSLEVKPGQTIIVQRCRVPAMVRL